MDDSQRSEVCGRQHRQMSVPLASMSHSCLMMRIFLKNLGIFMGLCYFLGLGGGLCSFNTGNYLILCSLMATNVTLSIVANDFFLFFLTPPYSVSYFQHSTLVYRSVSNSKPSSLRLRLACLMVCILTIQPPPSLKINKAGYLIKQPSRPLILFYNHKQLCRIVLFKFL